MSGGGVCPVKIVARSLAPPAARATRTTRLAGGVQPAFARCQRDSVRPLGGAVARCTVLPRFEKTT